MPRAVGTLHRLDLDHVGAEEPEDLRGVRACPVRGEVEDAETHERTGRVGGVVAGGGPCPRRFGTERFRVGARRRDRSERPGRARTQSVRDARLHHLPARVLDEHVAFHERREAGHRLAVPQGGDRDPPLARDPHDFVGRARGGERGDLGAQHAVVLPASVDPSELGVVGPLGVPDHLRERRNWAEPLVAKPTQPSAVGSTDGTSTKRPITSGSGPRPSNCAATAWNWLNAMVIASNVETSTWAPRPVRRTPWSAASGRRRRPIRRPIRRSGPRSRPGARACGPGWRSIRTRPAG